MQEPVASQQQGSGTAQAGVGGIGLDAGAALGVREVGAHGSLVPGDPAGLIGIQTQQDRLSPVGGAQQVGLTRH